MIITKLQTKIRGYNLTNILVHIKNKKVSEGVAERRTSATAF